MYKFRAIPHNNYYCHYYYYYNVCVIILCFGHIRIIIVRTASFFVRGVDLFSLFIMRVHTLLIDIFPWYIANLELLLFFLAQYFISNITIQIHIILYWFILLVMASARLSSFSKYPSLYVCINDILICCSG